MAVQATPQLVRLQNLQLGVEILIENGKVPSIIYQRANEASNRAAGNKGEEESAPGGLAVLFRVSICFPGFSSTQTSPRQAGTRGSIRLLASWGCRHRVVGGSGTSELTPQHRRFGVVNGRCLPSWLVSAL